MALEQKIETVYFTSGDGYEAETLPREVFSAPTHLSLEPEQIPFLLSGTNLTGYHDLGEKDGEPVRKLLLGLNDPKKSKRFELLGNNAQPIPVYDSPKDALFELQPRILPYQRENTSKLVQTLAQESGTLRFASEEYSGAVSFANGKVARATLRSPQETLYGEPALTGFLLLFSYQPLRFEQKNAETRRLAPDSASVVQPLAASTLPAYAHALREKLEQKGLDQHLFNVQRAGESYSRVSGPDYTVLVRFSKVPIGLLRFMNGKFYDGEMRSHPEKYTGDFALTRALELSTQPEITFERPNSDKFLQLENVGGPANKSALATTALYLVGQ